MKAVAIALLAVVATGCSPTTTQPGGATVRPQANESVPWSDYAPGLQARIDSLGDAADCSGLQTEFDTADANNQLTQNRVGHNNADLMAYIDDTMREAGCYD